MAARPMANDGSTRSRFVQGVLDGAGSPVLTVPASVQPGAERAIDLSSRGIASNSGDSPAAGPISSAAREICGDALSGTSLGSHPERGNRPINSRGDRL
jgi:hypothetical protein